MYPRLAGVPSTYPSASSTSTAVAVNAGRATTSTPSISGVVAPDRTASNSEWTAGEGVWWTISSRAMPRRRYRPNERSVRVRLGGAVVAERLVPLGQRRGQALLPGLGDERLEARLGGGERGQVGTRTDRGPQPHHVHRPVHGPLVELGDVGWHLGDALGHGDDVLVELGDRIGVVGPTEAGRLDARDRVAGQHHLH